MHSGTPVALERGCLALCVPDRDMIKFPKRCSSSKRVRGAASIAQKFLGLLDCYDLIPTVCVLDFPETETERVKINRPQTALFGDRDFHTRKQRG